MRIIFSIFIVLSNSVFAQISVNNYKRFIDIAQMEQLSHQRLSNNSVKKFSTTASQNFDVSYYRCEWEIDPAIKYIKGCITVYFTTMTSTNNIVLDLMNDLVVDSVKQRNNILTKSHINNELTINFDAPYLANSFDSVSIYYQGVPATSGYGSFSQSIHNGIPIMWNLSESYGSRDWWPCKNGLNDKADSIDVIIKHPVVYKAASNGMLQSEENLGAFVKTHWKHRYPIATYLICFAITNYVVFSNTVQLGDVVLPMQTYCYPESLASFKAGNQNTFDAMKLFDKFFGDYPFLKEKYGHVQFDWGGGIEHQTSTFISLLGGEKILDEELAAHELAHQWFGDKITCGSWEDIWLNEGFATHSMIMYVENKYPFKTIEYRKEAIDYITSEVGGSVKVDDTTDINRIFDSRLSYVKGSHLLFMLRFILGDKFFFEGVKAYLNDPKLAYKFATTNDLKQHLEQVSGKDLTQFFKDWYEGQGFPSYQIKYTWLGNNQIKIVVNQTTSHPSVAFFALPIALKFKKDNLEKTIVIDNKFNGEIFIKDIEFDPDTVIIDPQCWLISKNNMSTKVKEAIFNPQTKSIVNVYPNPIKDKVYISYKNFSAGKGALILYNNIGQIIF